MEAKGFGVSKETEGLKRGIRNLPDLTVMDGRRVRDGQRSVRG